MTIIEQAKEYLSHRLEAELSYQNNLETLLDENASKLVDIAYASNIPPTYFSFSYNKKIEKQVDALIDDILSEVIDDVDTLAVSTHTGNKDKILNYIHRDIYGQTLSDRADSHTQTFKKEMEGIIAAGLILDVSKSNIKQSIRTYRKMPYQNPIFRQALKLGQGSAEALKDKGLHFGVGISNSSYNALNYLGRYEIAEGWEYNDFLDMSLSGAVGYEVHRGSNKSCSDCQDLVGFHSFSEGMVLPEHVHCQCYAIPVFKQDIS